MILEGAVLGSLGVAVAHRVNLSKSEAARKTKEIKQKWREFSEITLKDDEKFEILDIFIKHYGFDAIISIPIGKNPKSFMELIPKVSVIYGADVIAEPSQDKKSIYMRVHHYGQDISQKDNIKFKWYLYFQQSKFRNNAGETYRLLNGKDIKNPMDKKEIIGTRFDVDIPNGLSFNDLEKQEIELGRIFGICQIKYNHNTKTSKCEILTKRIDDEVVFKPIKVKPWELYVGMEHNWTPMIFDYSQLPNGMVSGRVGSGKTVALIMAMLNLELSCQDEFDLYISMVGEKQDLAIFKQCKNTKYYARNIVECAKLLRYLIKEMNRRNELFQRYPMCFNIFRYNSLVKKENKMKFIHFICDEVADLMVSSELQDLLFDLIRKARVAGIYVTVASQRFSLANISPEIKQLLCNKAMFKMSNSASALTVASGDNVANKIVSLPPNREFVADNGEIKIAKTLKLTEDHMIKLIKPCIEENHKYLNLTDDGRISKENSKKEDKKEPRFKEWRRSSGNKDDTNNTPDN